MIPFIDVSLVLLIIFMIMTPILVKEQIKINLPVTKGAHSPVDNNRLLQIDVTREGAICVDGTRVSDDDAFETIRKLLTDPENQPVMIAADRDVPFEKVVVAMDAVKRCGAKRMGVSVKHGAASDTKSTRADEAVKPRNTTSSVDKTKNKSPGASSGGTKRSASRTNNNRKKDL